MIRILLSYIFFLLGMEIGKISLNSKESLRLGLEKDELS